jgi:hypothetical protein
MFSIKIGDREPDRHNTPIDEHVKIDPPLQKNPSGQFTGKENGSQTIPSGHRSQFPNELIKVPGGQDMDEESESETNKINDSILFIYVL